MNLGLLLCLIVISLVAGATVTIFGYYMPFVIASAVLTPIAAGLLSTFKPDTGHQQWLGYSAFFGLCLGMGFQQPLIAVQTVLPLRDVPVGTAVIVFAQNLGGALFISVAQNIFSNQLLKNLVKYAPNVNPFAVFEAGATNLKAAASGQDLAAVLAAYNKTLTQVFYVSVATSALSLFGAVFMEWKSVKGKKKAAAAGA